MSGMYEKFAPIIFRETLTSAEAAILEGLVALSDSTDEQYLIISGGLVQHSTFTGFWRNGLSSNRTLTVSATAPVDPQIFDLWYDIS